MNNPSHNGNMSPPRHTNKSIARADEVRRERVARWRLAKLLLDNAAREKISFQIIATRMADKMGLRGMAASTPYRFFAGKHDPGQAETLAFCLVLKDYGVDVDPGWLEFGTASGAPAPEAARRRAVDVLEPPARIPHMGRRPLDKDKQRAQQRQSRQAKPKRRGRAS